MGVTSCTHAHYGDSCNFAVVKGLWWLLIFDVKRLLCGSVFCYREWKRSICCSASDSWVAIVGGFVEVLRAERRMVWPRWLPLSTSIVSIYHRRLLLAFNTVSVTVIHKAGLDKLRIVNCMFLATICKIWRQKMLVTWSEDDRTPCICPNACAADLHSSR